MFIFNSNVCDSHNVKNLKLLNCGVILSKQCTDIIRA